MLKDGTYTAWFKTPTGQGTGIAHVQVERPEAFAAALPEADVVVVSMMWKNDLAPQAKRLKFVQSISAGIDQYDQKVFRAHGIRLANAAGVNAAAVSEHAMALILALKRHIHTGRDNQAAKIWRGMISDIPAREDELGGKTLLIVGLGKIGARLAKLAKAFDLKVVATRRNASRALGPYVMHPPLSANSLAPAIVGSRLCSAKSARRRICDECRSDPKIMRASACPARMAVNAPSKSARPWTATG